MVYMKANIDVCALFHFRTFSLKDHKRQLYHAKKDSHGWHSDFTSKRMDHKMNNNGSNYKKKKKKKKGNPHMIIDTMLYYTRLMKESKNVERVWFYLQQLPQGMLPKLKDITCACIHLLHLLLIFFCRVPQEKIQWKVESRPYDSNYAINISEN